MKASAIRVLIMPMLITWLSFILLIPNNVMGQNKQGKNAKAFKTERADKVNQGKKISTLTDDQKAKMQDLRLEHMKAIRSLKAENAEMEAHLKTLNTAENPDTKAIFKTIDEMVATRAEIMKRSVSFKLAVKSILTPEQIKQMQLRELNRRPGMGQRNQGWGQQGRRNAGRGQMAQRGGMNGMNRPGAMMNRQGAMMDRPGAMMDREEQMPQGPKMNRQGQMNRKGQMMRREMRIVSDSTSIK